MNFKTVFLIGFLAFLIGILFGLKLISERKQTGLSKVVFGDQVILVETATTPHTREQGLSGREFLEPGHGMLFLFEKEAQHNIWMKDMKFDLDFVFLKGKTVVDLKENVPSPLKAGKVETVTSEKEFDKLLEIESGAIDSLDLEIGDQAEIVF